MVTCCGGAYVRDHGGVWRYAWGAPVPGARDLIVAEVISLWGDPLEVMRELGRTVDDDVRSFLEAARAGVLSCDRTLRDDLLRWLGGYVCGPQAPELLGHALLDGTQLARRLQVTRATIDSYRTRGRLPPPQVVRGRTPLWSAPIVRRWVIERGR